MASLHLSLKRKDKKREYVPIMCMQKLLVVFPFRMVVQGLQFRVPVIMMRWDVCKISLVNYLDFGEDYHTECMPNLRHTFGI